MSRFKIGLQLYSVREQMEQDMEATLKAVSEMGYDCVEFAGYFGKTAEEVKSLCDKYKLIPISVHQPHKFFLQEPEKNIQYLKTLGIKYSAIPWIGQTDWEARYDDIIKEIKEAGELLKKNDIQLMYHNHDFEFCTYHNGECILHSLYTEVPSDILWPELDLCWVHYAGKDPVEYVKKYGDIHEVIHIKDFVCKNLALGPIYALIDENAKESNAKKRDRDSDGFEFRAIGYGWQNISAIMKAAEGTKIKYIIVEQDAHSTENSALEDAKDSIDYLKSIGY